MYIARKHRVQTRNMNAMHRKYRVFVPVLLLLTIDITSANSFNKTNTEEAAVTIEKIRRGTICDRSLQRDDVGIFDIETFYKSGEEIISGRKEGSEKEPETIQVGKTPILQAFEEAIIGMCPGEYRKITIPPEKAYRNMKLKLKDGRIIPPYTTVIVHATLIQIVRQTDEYKRQSFTIWDTDNNGIINKQELEGIIGVVSKLIDEKDDMTDSIDGWFSDMDSNKDGGVTQEEFFAVTKTSFDDKANAMMKRVMKKFTQVFQPKLNKAEKRALDEL